MKLQHMGAFRAMSSISIDSSDKQLRELDSEIRYAMQKLLDCRTHQNQASINRANSRGVVLNSRDGRTVDSNKLRAAKFEETYLQAKQETQKAEARVKELNDLKLQLQK